MRYLTGSICFLLLTFSVNVLAESVFVNDKLRVGVRPEPSQIVAPIGVVLTGMKLEVLDRKAPFIKIRTDKGLEGWIKDIYVTSEVPAVLRLKEIEKEQKKSRAKMADIEKTRAALEEANSILNEKIDLLKAQRAELQRANAVQIVSSARPGKGISLLWLALSLVVGVVIGYLWHRRQSMKRLGGLRI